jgi:hypothetical protein
MLLNFDNRDPFCTGSAPYRYSRVPGSGDASRIIVQVEVDGDPIEAILDTGGGYFLCNPELAESIGIDPDNALDRLEIRLPRFSLRGVLHRLPISLLTSGDVDDGESYPIEVTAFFPDPDQVSEDQLPYSYLGMYCCMERFRFAIDPSVEQERFYFGACP